MLLSLCCSLFALYEDNPPRKHTRMQRCLFTGLPVERWLARSVTCLLFILVLTHLCLTAPGLPGGQREETPEAPPPSTMLANPFGPGEEERKCHSRAPASQAKTFFVGHTQPLTRTSGFDNKKNREDWITTHTEGGPSDTHVLYSLANERLLQNYIQNNLKDQDGGPKISSWEQEVFFLFRLYDYDRSGHLDGLELMKLLSDYNSYSRAQTNEPVVSMVDFLLQTQDLNQDGLLGPSELLSPPLPQTQQKQGVEDTEVNAISETDEGVHKEREVKEGQGEEQRHKEPSDQQQHTREEEKPAQEREALHEDGAAVHQGQPEM